MPAAFKKKKTHIKLGISVLKQLNSNHLWDTWKDTDTQPSRRVEVSIVQVAVYIGKKMTSRDNGTVQQQTASDSLNTEHMDH